MRLPSLERLVGTALDTARRFPVALWSAVLTAVLLLVVVEDPVSLELLVRGAMASALLVPLTFAIDVFTERPGRERLRRPLLGAAILAAGVFFLASRGWGEAVVAPRFVQLFLAAHLLVAFLPFAGTHEDGAFWQFNRALFLRFAVATLYTGVLYIGLVLALVSVDALFGVDVRDETYFQLFILLAAVAHPWTFLAGVPRDVPALERDRSYPAGLKIFSQFVLIPLVTVYLAILTAYLVRVLVTQEWPSGWIGWLVSSVSVVGTLALLLVHPVRDLDENRWVNGYARWFWVALMPSIVMLYMAIGQRIAQYGFTENRYFLLVLSVWISGIAVYLAFTRSRRIRWIPISLCAVAVVTFIGPWSAYSVAERSQVDRLRALLAANGVTDIGAAAGAAAGAPFEDEREISAVLRYLIRTRGHEPVAALLGEASIREHAADPATTGYVAEHRRYSDEDAKFAAEFLGVRYLNQWQGPEIYVSARAAPAVWPVPEGYTHTLRTGGFPSSGASAQIDGHSLEWSLPGGSVLRVTVDGGSPVAFQLGALLPSLMEAPSNQPWNIELPPERMTFERETAGVRVRLHLHSLGGRIEAETLTVQNVDGDLFVAFPDVP